MSDDRHLREEFVSREEVLHGSFLHVVRDTVRLPDGGQATREFILHPGAVMVVPMLDDGRIVMERQFRHPVGEVILEFPAGKVDAGEPRLACAQRELLEETGYTAREWAKAGELYPTIAYADESIDIWFARGLALTRPQLDAGEFLEVFTATPQELFDACRDGRIRDGKTLAGCFWLQNVLAGTWKLDWQALPSAV